MKKKNGAGENRRRALFGLLVAALPLLPAVSFADSSGAGQYAMTMDGKWAVLEGSSLKSTLEGWSAAAGWTLIWDNPIDYRLRASATFGGGFEEAVGRLIDSIYQHIPEINVHLYRGNRVIHIQEQTLTSQ